MRRSKVSDDDELFRNGAVRSCIDPDCATEGLIMAKGTNKRGKEAKKPKQVKTKVLATADSNAGKSPLVVAGKKIR